MRLEMDMAPGISYKGTTQKTRVITEKWVSTEIYCPSCGFSLVPAKPNSPVEDFNCARCQEQYELKSKGSDFGSRVNDGAYKTMIERLNDNRNPNLFLLAYRGNSVQNFLVIPKFYFTPEIIEKRKPLSKTARRAGWVGCNIIISGIPESGKIFLIKNSVQEKKDTVIEQFNKGCFLKETKIKERGWLIDVMKCVETVKKSGFKLEEIYRFERSLSKLHPDNRHVKEKIRQQLQVLRDRGYLKFEGRGKYSVL